MMQITITFRFRRGWMYWLFKYVVTMDIIVATSWGPFFARPRQTSDVLSSLSIIVTALLALVHTCPYDPCMACVDSTYP
jgi:hypothetical protein